MLVEAEIRDQLFQFAVLLLEKFRAAQSAHGQPTVHLLRAVKRLLRNSHATDHIRHRVPVSACFNAHAICSFVYFDFFMPQLVARRLYRAGKLSLKLNEETGRTSIFYPS